MVPLDTLTRDETVLCWRKRVRCDGRKNLAMEKTRLSESDVCAKYINPALYQAGWDEATQIRREVSFTKGCIIVRSKLVSQGEGERADYVLYYKPTLSIALIEEKLDDIR